MSSIVSDPLIEDILAQISFRAFSLERTGSLYDASEIHGKKGYAALDVANTSIWDRNTNVFHPAFLEVPRLSTVANAYILSRLVQSMSNDAVYLNIGTWCGWSLFAGVIDGSTKTVVGVDNFSSDQGEARKVFLDAYAKFQTGNMRFHEMDYLEYFRSIHHEPIGVYFYDGDHAYEHQLKALEVAHASMASGCYVVVDDTNMEGPYKATMDFVAAHPEYSVVLDKKTANNGHPTFWNGLLILKKK